MLGTNFTDFNTSTPRPSNADQHYTTSLKRCVRAALSRKSHGVFGPNFADLVTAVEHPAASRASSYGLEEIVIDGNDVDEVYTCAQRVIEQARAGEGPSLVEAITYRLGGHSRADTAKYRPEAEVEAWQGHDAIELYHRRLLSLGVDEVELTAVATDVAAQVDAATDAAKAGPLPPLEEVHTQMFADGGSSWRN